MKWGQNVHSGTSSPRGSTFSCSQSETMALHITLCPEWADSWVHTSSWVLLAYIAAERQPTVRTGKSWILPKSSRSAWICVSISGGCSQHAQLPLKISMEPTSTEATANLLPPLCSFPALLGLYLLIHFLHLACPSSPLYPLCRYPRLTMMEMKGQCEVKAPLSHQSQFHFVTCPVTAFTLLQRHTSSRLSFMNTQVEWRRFAS